MSNGARKRFLLAMWEGGGTIPPELGVARALLARGHEVRVLADPTVESAARAAGCAFSPWVRAPHRTSLDPASDPLHDWTFKNPFALFKHAIDAFFFGPAAEFAADTLETIDRHGADLVLSDWALSGVLVGAESRKLPHVALVPNIYMAPAPGIPPIGLGLQPARGPFGRLRDALLAAVGDRLWRRGLPHLNRARTTVGLPSLGSVWEQCNRADAVYVLTARAFDFPAKRLPANVRYVGPQLDDPNWAERWTPPWPAEDPRPLVLISLSSTFQDQAAVLRRIVAATAALPIRALVTLGPAMRPADFPSPSENVVVIGSAPHTQVLAQASAMITHCGHGSVMKALVAGVPIVGIPMGRDQHDTAARVVARDAGLRLKTTASAGAIRAAVSRVLAEERFRDGARRLGAAIRAESEANALGAAIEALLIPDAKPAIAPMMQAAIQSGSPP